MRPPVAFRADESLLKSKECKLAGIITICDGKQV
jgi:hypothetical protein